MVNGIQNNRQFSLEIDEQLTNKLSDFCKQVGISQSPTVNIAINYFFDDSTLIHSLMDGYREMGNLNRELTHDFLASEAEAEIHLAQYRNKYGM